MKFLDWFRGLYEVEYDDEEEPPLQDGEYINEVYTLPDKTTIYVRMCHECEGQGDVTHGLEPNPYGVIRITCPVCMGFGILKFKRTPIDEVGEWIPNT